MTTAATIRWHRFEQRRRRGTALYEIEADTIGLEELLKYHGVLPSSGAENHSEIVTAYEELTKRLIADVIEKQRLALAGQRVGDAPPAAV